MDNKDNKMNMNNDNEEVQVTKGNKFIVPIAITVILAVFAGIVFYANFYKPSSELDKEISKALEGNDEVDLDDYISVGNITGLTFDVTQQMWDECVDEDTHYYQQADKAIEKNDEVDLNIIGMVNGKKDKNISRDEQTIDIVDSNEGLDKQIADALIGLKENDTKTIKVDGKDINGYSMDGSDYSGKNVSVKLEVITVSEPKVDKVTDKWVQSNYFEERGVSTVDEFYEWEKQYIDENEVKTGLWQKAIDQVKLKKMPQELHKNIVEALDGDTEKEAENQGMSVEDYKKFFGIDDAKQQENYTLELKSELLMWYIVREEKLEATPDEISEAYEMYMEEAGIETIEEMKETYTEQEMKEIVLLDKAQNYVVENSKVTYSYTIK